MLVKEQPCNGGTQKLYRFENGYGASVIRHPFSYGSREGLWELGLIIYLGEGEDDWELHYDIQDFPDVIGYLSNSDVEELLTTIKALPAPK
jgi:hypothetical protein